MADTDTIVNSVLCFINSARSDYSYDSLSDVIYSFYSHEEIKSAKELLGNLVKKDVIWRRDPDKKRKDLKDLLEFHDDFIASKSRVNLVTKSHKKMPPIGLELFAPILTNLVEEMSKINEVLPKILDIKTEVCNTADTVRQMKIDVNEIKSKFSHAINGIQEAAKDFCETEENVMEELHAFRHSIGVSDPLQCNLRCSTDGMNDQLGDFSYAGALKEGRDRVHVDDVAVVENGSHHECRSPSIPLHPASGAINKQTRFASRRSSISLRPRPLQLPVNTEKSGPEEESETTTQVPPPSLRDDWTLVSRDKRKSRENIRKKNSFKQTTGVTGSKKDENQMFRAATRTADVFVGRVDKAVADEDLKNYVKINFGVQILSVTKLTIRSEFFNAFKINVKSNDRDKLFNAELWPEDIVVNKFYNRVRYSNRD